MRLFLKSLLSILLLITMQSSFAIEMAITVDDLPGHGPLPPNKTRLDIANEMLAVFKKHHIRAVYGFINANKINKEPDGLQVLQAWVADGQLLANHTFSHLDLINVTPSQYIADIKNNEPILTQLMLDKNYKYFRYPYLAEGNDLEKRNAVRNYLFKNGYAIAPVTVDFFDYEWNAPYVRCMQKNNQQAIVWLEESYLIQSLAAIDVAQNLSQLLFKRDIKHILLIHIGAFDAAMLDKLLTAYENKGVHFITLEEALRDNAYKINPNIARDRTYTFLNQIRLAKGLQNPAAVNEIYASLPEDRLNMLCK